MKVKGPRSGVVEIEVSPQAALFCLEDEWKKRALEPKHGKQLMIGRQDSDDGKSSHPIVYRMFGAMADGHGRLTPEEERVHEAFLTLHEFFKGSKVVSSSIHGVETITEK